MKLPLVLVNLLEQTLEAPYASSAKCIAQHRRPRQDQESHSARIGTFPTWISASLLWSTTIGTPLPTAKHYVSTIYMVYSGRRIMAELTSSSVYLLCCRLQRILGSSVFLVPEMVPPEKGDPTRTWDLPVK